MGQALHFRQDEKGTAKPERLTKEHVRETVQMCCNAVLRSAHFSKFVERLLVSVEFQQGLRGIQMPVLLEQALVEQIERSVQKAPR